MTPGALESEFAKLAARVAELEASRCTHAYCQACETASVTREKLALRRRCADAAAMSARVVASMPDAFQVANAMTDAEIYSLLDRATSHAEQDQVLALLKSDRHFRVDLYACRVLPEWLECRVRVSGDPNKMEPRAYSRRAANLAALESRTSAFRTPETIELARAAGVTVDINGEVTRPAFGAGTILARTELDFWCALDPAFARAVQEELEIRTLPHDEAYDHLVRFLVRDPRGFATAVRALPRKPIAGQGAE